MFDAAFPPGKPYPGAGAVAGYIGGNTPHVWTTAEWNAASNGGQLAQLPIWVGYQENDPGQHAADAAAKATALGWTPHHPFAWRAIVLDVEAESIGEAWLQAFGERLADEGFLCWPYMSASVLSQDPPGYSIWLPTFSGVPAIPNIHNVIAAQYHPSVSFDGTAVDLSVVDPAALTSFGTGLRH
jgi:hypothetical protein